MFVQVYVEYSNEVWNGIFRQNQYTVEKGAPLFPADPSFRQGLKYFNKRAAEVAAIWEQVQTPSTGLRHPSFNHCRI